MSVIAKVSVRGVDQRYGAHVLEAGCVAENPLMAMYSPSDEDILFSKASPSGELRADFFGNPTVLASDNIYVIFTRDKPEKAWAWSKAKVQFVTDFGGTTRQVNITGNNDYGRKKEDYAEGELRDFRFNIMIDNPGAYEQFVPQDAGWWVSLHRASQVTMEQAKELTRQAPPADTSEGAEVKTDEQG